MNEHFAKVAICFLTVLVAGCTKPDVILNSRSTTAGLYLTVEQFHEGPLVADDTKVYVHLERNGQSKKRLVLWGEYLSFSKVSWIAPNEISMCLTAGQTAEYHNEVLLSVDGSSEKVHVYLHEQC